MEPIPNYSDKYFITRDGRVWSTRSKRFLRPQKTRLGYSVILLFGLNGDPKKYKTHSIHRLVAAAYISNPHNKPNVNHKNSVRDDNHFTNLEWCTQQENIMHAVRTGRIRRPRNLAHPNTKLSDRQISQIRPRLTGKYGQLTQLAKHYGVSVSLLSLIKSNKYRQYA